MLIIFGGLPDSGKTTIAWALAKRLGAVHLRIDTIEQTVRDSGMLRSEVGPAGAEGWKRGRAMLPGWCGPLRSSGRQQENPAACRDPFCETVASVEAAVAAELKIGAGLSSSI